MKKIILGAVCAVSLLAGVMESNAVTIYKGPGAWAAWAAAAGAYSTEDFEGEAIGEHLRLSSGVLVNSAVGSVQDGNALPSRGWLGTVHNDTQVWWDQLTGTQETEFAFPQEICGFGGNWNPHDIHGAGSGIIVCNASDCERVGNIDVISRGLGNVNNFWGFVSNIPFTTVYLSTPSLETYILDDMVFSGCGCEELDEFKALITIDNTEPDNDMVRFQMLGAAGVPSGVCTGDFSLELREETTTSRDIIFDSAALDAGADVHCKCNNNENCFVTVRRTDINAADLDPFIDGPITATFTVGDKCYKSTDDWRQQDAGSGNWIKFRTP